MDEAILVSIMGLLALSPVVTPAAISIENRLRLGHPSKLMALSLHFFCAYSAHCVCGNGTWGVAPGCKLLHFQCALLAEVSLPPTKQVSVFTVTIARDEKTDLHVSNDGSQHRKSRSLRLTRPF